jgi:energy-coupling factor transport system substrate-specific component
MIPAGIALNWVANSIVEMMKLPIFLNNIGTVLNSIVLGPWYGAATAVLTNLVLALTVRWTYIPFALVGVLVAFLAHWSFKHGWFRSLWKILVSGAVVGAIGSVLSTFISVYAFGGFSGAGNDIITAGLVAAGQKIFNATFMSNLPTTMIDKMITFWIVWSILKIFPSRYLPNASAIKEKMSSSKKTMSA